MKRTSDFAHLFLQFKRIAKSYGAPYPSDVAQDVYVKLLEEEQKSGNIDKFMLDTNELNMAYMFVIVRNLASDQRKEEAKYVSYASLPNRLISTSDNNILNDVLELIRDFPKKQQTVFIDYAFNDYNYRELSEREDVSIPTIFRRVREVKERVKRLW